MLAVCIAMLRMHAHGNLLHSLHGWLLHQYFGSELLLRMSIPVRKLQQLNQLLAVLRRHDLELNDQEMRDEFHFVELGGRNRH